MRAIAFFFSLGLWVRTCRCLQLNVYLERRLLKPRVTAVERQRCEESNSRRTVIRHIRTIRAKIENNASDFDSLLNGQSRQSQLLGHRPLRLRWSARNIDRIWNQNPRDRLLCRPGKSPLPFPRQFPRQDRDRLRVALSVINQRCVDCPGYTNDRPRNQSRM